MIVARTLASAARSCIQRCRQSRGRATRCSFGANASPGQVTIDHDDRTRSRRKPPVGWSDLLCVPSE